MRLVACPACLTGNRVAEARLGDGPKCGHCGGALLEGKPVELDEARFAKVNTDAEQALAARYAIRAIPTLILFRDGAEVKRHSGAMDAGSLARWINPSGKG